MLTDTRVLDFIKKRLGFPVNVIELRDADILDTVKKQTIPLFSQYVPDVNEILLDINDPNVQTDDETVYFINDPDNAQIIDVVKVIPTSNVLYAYGWPIMGTTNPSLEEAADVLLQLTKTETALIYSPNWPAWRFYPPNRLRIIPKSTSYVGNLFVIRYEREHPRFETIPAVYERDFLDLALADIYDYIAAIRMKFTNYTTPWGEASLNWDMLQSKATEIRDRVLERLRRRPPDVMVRVR